ncbi:hypothetical protein FIE12Z_5220, partial [Fusarium flagelliforme]
MRETTTATVKRQSESPAYSWLAGQLLVATRQSNPTVYHSNYNDEIPVAKPKPTRILALAPTKKSFANPVIT